MFDGRRYGFSLFLALLLLLGGVLMGSAVGAAEPANTPVHVAEAGPRATDDNGQRKLVQTDDGTLELIYVQLEDGVGQIFVTSSADDGRSWSEPVRLSRPGISAALGSLTEDIDGRLHAAWVDRETVGHVWYAVRQAGVWSESAKVSPGPFYAGFPVIATEGGRVHLLWYAAVPDEAYDVGSRYEIIHLVGFEGEWGLPTVVSVGGLDALNPTVAQDRSGVVHTAWYERDVGRYQAHYAFLDEGKWRVPTVVSPDTSNAFGVAMDIGADGTVHLVWEQLTEQGPAAHYSYLADGRWSSPIILAPAPAVDPVLASDDSGRLFAAWSDRASIYFAEMRDGAWATATNLGPGTHPTLAAGNPVHIAWTRPAGAGYEVVVASLGSSVPGESKAVLIGLVGLGILGIGAAAMLLLRRRRQEAATGMSSTLTNSGK